MKSITYLIGYRTIKHEYASGSWRWAAFATGESTNIDWSLKFKAMNSLLQGKNTFYFDVFSVDLARIILTKISECTWIIQCIGVAVFCSEHDNIFNAFWNFFLYYVIYSKIINF